jgi:hypothetical protein
MDTLQSHYCINIAKRSKGYRTGGLYDIDSYTHHFAIDIIHEDKAKEVFKEMTVGYPHPEYQISVTHWNISGRGKEWKP